MAGDTARLLTSLDLKDNLTPGINKAIGSVGRLESSVSRIGAHAQRGIGNAINNIQRLAIVGAAGLVGAVAFGIRSLEDLNRTTEQTNAVIASTKGAAGVSAAAVRDYAESLENLTTVDDKVIQDGENMLLTFTGIGKDIFPRATKAALNMAIAMNSGHVEGLDLKTTAIQLGKALNDPIKGMGALRKNGVAFTEAQQKQIKALVAAGKTQQAQVLILRELEKEFGEAGEAAAKGPGAVWRRLQDVGEGLSQTLARGLLPVLEKVGTWLATKLADKTVITRIDALGVSLGKMADQAFAFIQTVDFEAIANALGTAVGFAGQLVGAFLAMPDWVKVAVLTGWGLNKLTGGALGDIAKEGIKLVFDQFAGRGSSPANPVFVSAIGGGLGGPGGGAGLGLLGATGIAALIVAAAIPLGEAFKSVLPKEFQGPGGRGESESQRRITEALGKTAKILGSLDKPGQTGGPSLGERDDKRTANLKGILERAVAAGFKPGTAAIERTFAKNAAHIEVITRNAVTAARENIAAIKDRGNTPQPVTNVKVTVNVTAAQVNKSTTIQRRFGWSGGSRERGSTERDI